MHAVSLTITKLREIKRITYFISDMRWTGSTPCILSLSLAMSEAWINEIPVLSELAKARYCTQHLSSKTCFKWFIPVSMICANGSLSKKKEKLTKTSGKKIDKTASEKKRWPWRNRICGALQCALFNLQAYHFPWGSEDAGAKLAWIWLKQNLGS